MGSLKDCLEKIYGAGALSPEARAVSRKAQELRKEGYTGKEAASEAVKYFLNHLADERQSVTEQVAKASGADNRGVQAGPATSEAEAARPSPDAKTELPQERETPRSDAANAPNQQAPVGANSAQTPDAGAPSGNASKGAYATEHTARSEGPASGSYHEMTAPFIDLPELVEMAKGLMKGKFPEVRRLIHRDPGITGWFRAKGEGTIALKAEIFKDWRQAAATLAHEIGHLADYLPDRTLGRGNILGRIASLKRYMQETLPKAPDAPGELTADDRKRLKAEAKKLLEAENANKVIDEEIVKTMPIEADDVLAIWNATAKAASANQDLYRYIAQLGTAEKKAIVKEALKGQVAAELQRFAKTVREKTGKTIPYTVSEQDILKRYQELIEKELRKRELLSREEIENELKQLSRAWKPFDPQANREYTRYRYSGKELYADAFSAMMNSPYLVRTTAPKFYEAWFNYLERKPEVQQIYNELYERNRAGDLDQVWSANMREAWRRNNELYGKKIESASAKDQIARDLVDANWFLIKRVHQVGPRNIAPGENPQYKMEDLSYTGSEIEWLMTRAFRDIVRPLEKVGLSWMDLEEFSFHRRVTAPESEFGGRSRLANPFGAYPERSQKRMDGWKAELQPRQWEALEKGHAEMHKLREYVLDKLEEAGIYGPDLIQKMRDAVNYARFDVAEYMEKRYGRGAGTKLYRQYGTLKENTGPATATLMRDISFIKSANRQAAAKTVVKFLRKNFPTEVKRIQKNRFGRVEEPADPTRGMIVFLEHGKLKAWEVPKDIAEIFDENPIASYVITRFMRHAGNFFRTIFTEINPGYWLFNVKRDFSRATANLPGAFAANFAPRWIGALKPAFKSVFGTPDAVVEEMQKGNMLISVADIRGMRPEDAQIEKLLKQYHLRPLSWKEHVINPFGSAFTYWSNIGRGLERTTKVATYRYLKSKFPNMSREEIAHVVRNTGSPDFLRGGRWTPLTNNVFLFSNAMVQGYRGDLEAMTSRGAGGFAAWWAKRAYRVALPKLLMWAALAGMLGEGTRRIMEGVSEYDSTNYIVVPLGLARNGSSVVLRIPLDETGRFLGGVLWKALTFQRASDLANLVDYTAGQAPTVNPLVDIVADAVAYASGRNPYDNFRGRYAVPEQVFKAGGARSFEAFAKYVAQKAGAHSVYRFESDDVEKIKGELETVLGWPMVSSTIGRFVKVTDYGLKEQSREARARIAQRRAGENLDARDAVNRMASGKELSVDDIKAMALVDTRDDAIQQALNGRRLGPQQMKSMSRSMERNLAVALGKRWGNVFVQEYFAAENNEERLAVIETFARINGQSEEEK